MLAGSHQTIPDDLENTANLASWLEAQGRGKTRLIGASRTQGAVQGLVGKNTRRSWAIQCISGIQAGLAPHAGGDKQNKSKNTQIGQNYGINIKA